MAEIIRIIIVNGGELTNGAAGLTGILPYTSWPVIYFFGCNWHYNFGTQLLAFSNWTSSNHSSWRWNCCWVNGVNVTKWRGSLSLLLVPWFQRLLVHFMSATSVQLRLAKRFHYHEINRLPYHCRSWWSGIYHRYLIAAVVLGIINMFLQNVSNLVWLFTPLALTLVMLFRPGGLLGNKRTLSQNSSINLRRANKNGTSWS